MKRKKIRGINLTKREKGKNKNRKFLARVLFGIGILLVLLLIGLILFSFDIFETRAKGSFFSIKDNCGPIMGNLIHQIKDDGECRIMCINECRLREKDFERSEFLLNNASCHECDCYCI